jgi:hypothetical protein
METVELGNLILQKLGLQLRGPQGENGGWSIEVVDDSTHFEKDSPGCARFKTSTIYLRRSSGEHRGTPFSGPELVQHEVAHALTGSAAHDTIFDAALHTVELASRGDAEDPEMLREAIGKLEPQSFQKLTAGAFKRLVSGMSASQFHDAVWGKSGLHFCELLTAFGITEDASVPGGRLRPPYRTKVDDGE